MNKGKLLSAIFFVLFCFASSSVYAAERAVVLAAFGSKNSDAVKSLNRFAEMVAGEHEETKFVLAFNSSEVVESLRDTEHETPSVAEACVALVEEGFMEIGILALYVSPGSQYDDVRQGVNALSEDYAGKVVFSLSPPLVNSEQDAFSLASYLIYSMPSEILPGDAVILAGYSAENSGSIIYPALNWAMFIQGERGSLYLAVNVDNRESVEQALNVLKLNKRKVVWVMPLMTASGNRAAKYIFSTDDESFASRLKDAGHTVRAHKQGLLANASVQTMWKSKLKRLLADMDRQAPPARPTDSQPVEAE